MVSGVLLLIRMLTLNFRKQIVALRFFCFIRWITLHSGVLRGTRSVLFIVIFGIRMSSSHPPATPPNEYQVSPQRRPDKTGHAMKHLDVTTPQLSCFRADQPPRQFRTSSAVQR